MKLDMKNINAIESSFVPNSCNSEEGLSFLIMLAFRFFFPWVYSCFLCKYSTTANSSIVPIRKNNETEIYIPRAVIFAVDGLWACWKIHCHMIKSYLSTHIDFYHKTIYLIQWLLTLLSIKILVIVRNSVATKPSRPGIEAGGMIKLTCEIITIAILGA